LEDPQPLVRGHAAWALGRVGSAAAVDALSSHGEVEIEPVVLDEVERALRH
jgi:epoxyqueuosine reductase